MGRGLASVAAAAFLCAASPAAAATIRVIEADEPHSEPYVEFTAGPGEANRVTATRSAGGLRVTDTGATIAAGHRCTLVSEHQALCEGRSLSARLADGDDSLTARSAFADGGEGNDTITAGGNLAGGPGDDLLTGGPRRDNVDGGGGHDVLRGGAGDDIVEDGDGPATGVGPDTIMGGPGSDLTSLYGRTTPVTVDLRRSSGQGEQGEEDTYADIESVNADAPAATLTGDARANRLTASGGPADLYGLAGNDVLYPAGGTAHRLWGGSGDDTLLPAAALNDAGVLRCGAGRDTLDGPNGRQVVPEGCEAIEYLDDAPFYFLRPRMRSIRSPIATVAPGFCSAQRYTPCHVVWAARRA